ncbi:MAG: YfhO family protein, partial [Oscillospiraceae bacterium]
IFSTLYSLMSYAVVQLMNPMWLDGLVFLPLIAYGVEKLVDEKKKLRYIIPLAIMFVANFYIGWMIGFFTLIYFLVYYFFGKKDEEYVRSETLKTFGRFAFSTIVAILCAAAILIPVYYSLKLGKLEFSSPTFDLLPKFAISDFFTKLLPESYDTVRPEGLPFVYCGVLTLFM